MRIFFGLELDTTTTLAIADWRDRQRVFDGRPVPPANFHITLAFIGELPAPSVDRLCGTVDTWLPGHAMASTTLRLDRTGYWPRPRLYWLGPSNWPDQLTALARKLGSLAGSVGGKRDRNPFVPHITLYRRCRLPPPQPALGPDIEMPYCNCTLFESRQARQGISYRPLQTWPLPAPS
ncbi:MAG: RNA 2',3'-cyclic phosphodiesterase [Halioglobus sp.]|nr:RNA 2',3'-cyclic phosphodiesterase [Halioglobus sp.]